MFAALWLAKMILDIGGNGGDVEYENVDEYRVVYWKGTTQITISLLKLDWFASLKDKDGLLLECFSGCCESEVRSKAEERAEAIEARAQVGRG